MKIPQIKNIFKISPESFFAITALIFGTLFIFLTPPLQGPDEQSHFLQAYKNSTILFSQKEELNKIPQSIDNMFNQILLGKYDIRFDSNKKFPIDLIKTLGSVKLNEKDQVITLYSGTDYSIISYAPQSFILSIAKNFNTSPLILMYLARLAGFIVWVLVIFLAIRTIPFGKIIIAGIALIPMSIFQSSVISADTISIAFSILLVSYISKLIVQKKEIETKQYFILGIISLIMVLGKPIYIILLPVIFLIIFKNTKFEKSKIIPFIKLCIITILSLILLFISLNLSEPAGNNSLSLPNGANPSVQLKNIITKPGEIAFALYNTYIFNWGDEVSRSFIGVFGWTDVRPPLFFVTMGYVYLFILLISNRRKDYIYMNKVLNPLSRVSLICLSIAFFLLTNITLYTVYTPVDFNIILGVQGRYLLPILLIFFLILINNNALYIKEKYYLLLTRLFPLVLLSISIFYLFTRYYVDSII